MSLNSEAKVGLVSIIGLIILGWIVMWVGHFDFTEKGYGVQAVFHQVDGLLEGNPVSYAGVEIGKVAEIDVTPKEVLVKLRIKSHVKIPEGSTFTINSSGLLGEKYVEILPNPNGETYLADGDKVIGVDPQRIYDLLQIMEQTAKDIQKLVNNINDVLGNEQSKAALKQAILSLQATASNMEVFSASLRSTAVHSEQEIIVTVKNMRIVSERLVSAANQADAFISQFSDNGKTGAELKAAMESIKRTADKVEHMASVFEKETTDPQTIQSIKATLKNAREASEKANKLLGKVGNIKVQAGAEVLGTQDAYQANFDVRIQDGHRGFLQAGVNDIGEEDKLNLQYGKQNGAITSRMGLFDGKAGVGFDGQFGDKTKVTVEVSDPNHAKIKLRGQYLIGDNALIIQKADVNNHQDPTYFGIRKNF
jgi:phospholipid/cholesterol/gamma-HCH transport system substrate-binding protein